MKTLSDYGFDGFAVLHDLVAESQYSKIEQAIASLTLFSHPKTVAQTRCKPIFHVIRNSARRGQFADVNGRQIAFDDNKSPTDAFLWCNNLASIRRKDLQFNHIFADSQNPERYSSLANLCVTPSFLAKLTDTHPSFRALLQYRSFELYGWSPSGAERPKKPPEYDGLAWASTLRPVEDVAATVRAIMLRKPKDRTVRIVRQIGWFFSDYRPEPSTDTMTAANKQCADDLMLIDQKRPRIRKIQHEKLRALARFADIFGDPNFQFSETRSPPSDEANVVIPPYEALNSDAVAFLDAIERRGWIIPFDWSAWTETPAGKALLSDPDTISEASVDDLTKLLTALFRKERFSEGTWGWAYGKGLLTAITRRADVLLRSESYSI